MSAVSTTPSIDSAPKTPVIDTKAKPNIDKATGNNLEGLVSDLAVAVNTAVDDIRRVNSSTHMLALNARIEAARAGAHGAAFGVVASEIQDLSNSTAEVAESLAVTTNDKITDLLTLIGSEIRGTRLSDLALTNIDLIDRCLYERTCDVRWWATDSSLTDALSGNESSAGQKEGFAYASQRLGVILSAYTVYHDLVLCDTNGRIVANGRPTQFQSTGKNCSSAPWFSTAISTRSGDEYGFQTAHGSDLAGGLPSLIYSCTVREDGKADGKVLGVLGILFNWSSLADPILQNLPIDEKEREETECFIIDSDGKILASKNRADVGNDLHLPNLSQILAESKGYLTAEYKARRCCIAHAKAPGFETYSTGWYSIIVQPLAD